MQQVNLNTSRILFNYVLIKPDPDYEFVKIGGKEGLEIKVSFNSETHGRHFGITGTVIKTPEKLLFLKDEIDSIKEGINPMFRTVSERNEISELTNSSLSFETDMILKNGDKVWFDYLCQINAVTDNLLVDTEEHGVCFLCRYDDIYCYQRNDEDIKLMNGWIWIKQIDKESEHDNGFKLVFNKGNVHEKGIAEVVKSSDPLKRYIDYSTESQLPLNSGDKILYNHKMGFPMEYAVHRKLTDFEVLSIRRKDIYAVL